MSDNQGLKMFAGQVFENVATLLPTGAPHICLSVFAALAFHSATGTQTAAVNAQEQAAKAPATVAIGEQVAEKVATRPRRVTRDRLVTAEVVTEPEAALAEPKVDLPKHPAVQIPASLRQAKAIVLKTAEPEEGNNTAPRRFHATAYSLPGRTRSGVYVHKGVLAADPRVLPLGSIVQVNARNYSGIYTVHDTGGAIKGNRVDVWVPTTREALRFGRRNVKLVVLRYGPGVRQPEDKKAER